MKIGINASFLRKPGTGIGQVTLSFLQTLAESEQGKAHTFFLYLEEDADIAFLPENFHIRTFLPWWKRDDLPRKWLWERQLAHETEKDSCDAFLSLSQSTTAFRKSKALKHVMIVHDIIPRFFPEYRRNMRQNLYWKAVERGIRAADHIVVVSEHTKNDLVRELGLSEERVSLAYPDVAEHFREPISDEGVASVLGKYDLKPGYIYHGGGLEVRKNAERLLRAYAKIVSKQTDSVQGDKSLPLLVISGKIFHTSNKLATDVEGLVEELGLQEKVRLLGFVLSEDIPALYRGALFFAYPSLYEGFGLPVLEAMRMRVPVLASDVSSLPEVAGDAAIYCDPQSVDSIASGMERLIADAALRETLVSKSAAQAVQFSWKSFVEKTLATLE